MEASLPWYTAFWASSIPYRIFLVFLVEPHPAYRRGGQVGRLIELEAGAVQAKHNFTCVDQLINNEAIFTETKQIQSRNIAVVDEKLNDECEHDV